MAITAADKLDMLDNIGGTYASAILGANPFMSALDVYLTLKGLKHQKEVGLRAQAGNLLEPALIKAFEEKTGLTVTLVEGLQAHPQYDFVGGHFDGMTSDGGILECKSSFSERGSEEIKESHVVQLMTYLWISGRTHGYILVHHFPSDQTNIERFERDEEMIRLIEERVLHFWHNHYLKDIPPEPQNQDEQLLIQRFINKSQAGKTVDVSANEAVLAAYRRVVTAKEQISALTAEINNLKKGIDSDDGLIRAAFGDGEKLVFNGKPIASYKSSERAAIPATTVRTLTYPKLDKATYDMIMDNSPRVVCDDFDQSIDVDAVLLGRGNFIRFLD